MRDINEKTRNSKGSQRARGIRNPQRFPEKRLFDVKEAAVYLGRPVYSVRQLIYSGALPVVRQEGTRKIYIDRADLDDHIQKNKGLHR